MTPPTGYRPCTADDLRDGAEILIPARVGISPYAAITTFFSVPTVILAGRALIRDDALSPAVPPRPDLSPSKSPPPSEDSGGGETP